MIQERERRPWRSIPIIHSVCLDGRAIISPDCVPLGMTTSFHDVVHRIVQVIFHEWVVVPHSGCPKFFSKEVTQKQATPLPRQELLTAGNRFRPNFRG
jgi:hypothetical protein